MMKIAVVATLLVAGLSGCSKEETGNNTPAGEDGGTAANDPTSRSFATAEKGALAVTNRKCKQCHGEDMSGATTPLATKETGVELFPPNLTNDDTGIKGWTDDQLATAIRQGYDKGGLQLCPQMKHESTMTDFEVFSIVLYLRGLPAKANAVPRSVCPPLKTKEEQNQPR